MKESAISLVGMRHAFGERIVSNEEIEAKYSLPKNWVFEKTGKEKGHAWDNGPDSPTEASLGCFKSLLVSTGIDKTKIKAVFGTTNPITIDGKTEGKSLTQKFAERADLSEDVYVSDEGFGCGGTAIGVESMCKWLQEQPIGTYAVYVTQDWPTKMVQDRNVEALFSDAVVPALVAEKLGINLQEYDIVPHQPNPKLLETIEKIYDVQMHKQVAREHGNPTCSGAFIALEKAMEDRNKGIGPNLQKDILVLPFGAGGVGGFILRNKTV